MLKIAFAAMCAIILFSSLINATTLQITSGGTSTFPAVPGDTFYNFSGPGFSVQGTQLDNTYFGGATWGIGISENSGFISTRVNVDGFPTCIPMDFMNPCGRVEFAISALPPVMNPATYLAIASFTASGQLDVGENCKFIFGQPRVCTVFDIVGQGTMTMRYSNALGVGFQPNASFAFGPAVETPEATSLALLPLGLIGIVFARRRQKRSA